MRSTCSVFCGVSLDGFIARPDDALDFLEGDDPAPDADYGYDEFMAGMDAVVMGRRTFNVVEGFDTWRYPKPLFVLSSQPVDLTAVRARGAVVAHLSGEPHEVVGQLAARGLHQLYVDGGTTVQRFLRAGLVDRLIVTHVPVLIGQGIRLFGPLAHDIGWKLVRSRSFDNGMVQCEYQRA
jgi:dihydrofolate reductase